MEVTLIEIYSKLEWEKCIAQCDLFDFYHTYDYHELSKTDNETPLLIKYVEGDIIIGIPLLTRNIPGTNYKDATSVYGYAGPISKNLPTFFDNSKFKKEILEFFLKNNFISVFSRLNPYVIGQDKILISIGTVTNRGRVVNINIQENIDLQRQKFQNRLKNQINKARRSCIVKEATTESEIIDFIEIYYKNMNRLNAKKSYFFNKAYFQKMINSQSFQSKILIALDNESETTIAGCQFITTNGIVQYHLSGAKTGYLHLNPTKLLIDEMRILATEGGNTHFNLGGGLGGRDDDSLFHFKSLFSKDFKDFNIWKLIINQKVYDDLVSKKGINNESEYFPLYRLLDDLILT
jgi:hypothetical protein